MPAISGLGAFSVFTLYAPVHGLPVSLGVIAKYMTTTENYFTWSDCWVITAILWTHADDSKIDLSLIIGSGDMLNRAIFTKKELKDGFIKAQKSGLISIVGDRIIIDEKGKEIRDNVKNMRGGLFSIVDNMEKKLNSKRTKFITVDQKSIDPCKFINAKSLKENYDKYLSIIKKR